jgi:hypothetical protein
MRAVDLTKLLPSVKRETLAQRIEDARLLLSIYGFLRPSESSRIRKQLEREWAKSTGATR